VTKESSEGAMTVGTETASGVVRPAFPERIRLSGVIAIGRRLDPARVVPIADALARAGVGAFEITMDSRDALGALATLCARQARSGELLIGAGTVLEIASAEEALAAGASFLVMPHTDPVLVAWAAQRGVAVFPGAFSPTEVLAAWRAGAAGVKLFPASVVGPAFVRESRGPFPEIPLIPTGGLTAESAAAFVEAGAAAVGMGGWLMGDGDPAGVEQRAREIVAVVERARAGRPA
jgi:2-dehydro-3-deoxyphosphogluconate aldolase/(4S)-4-hydroxy-2-oxoglutarate aldolase